MASQLETSIQPFQERACVYGLVAYELVLVPHRCDILSGFFQVMPVLTEMYMRMSPAHLHDRWHESRAHLDSGYVLELLVEVPLAAWVLWLFAARDPARYVVETFALAVQFAGTVTYYAPAIAKWEWACYFSYIDRTCGAVWLLYPLLLLARRVREARPDSNGGATRNSGVNGGKKRA